MALVAWSKETDRFPLRTIEVQAELKSVKESDIKAVVLPFLPKGFFWLNVKSVQKRLKEVPWVQSAEVRRLWPDRLAVTVKERTAQARWGSKGVLSTDGVVFYPERTSLPDKLPYFEGPEERVKDILENYLTFLELLGPVGLTIRELQLSPEGTWRIVLDNGVAVILGKTALNERMTRFVLAYQSRLQAQSGRIAYIDLRYANGFAVGWKSGTEIGL